MRDVIESIDIAAQDPAINSLVMELDSLMRVGMSRSLEIVEALERFKAANEMTPGEVRILNNIAVAQEANGMYEQALLTYQEALSISSGDTALKRNYSRFQEFYTSYIAPPEETEDAEEGVADDEENS